MRMPDGRLHPKAIAGPGAKAGHVLTWAGIAPKWAAPSGGGPLGSAYVEWTWTGTATSNGGNHDASAVTISATVGDPDLDVDPDGIGLISSATSTGLYVAAGIFSVLPTTNAVSGDVHQVELFCPVVGLLTSTFIGTAPAYVPAAGWVQRDAPNYDAPYFSMRCTGGTNRVYDGQSSQPIKLGLSLVRFPPV